MTADSIFQTINILLQGGLLVVAVFALKTWKKELKGKDEYGFAKNQLEKLKRVAFIIHSPDSFHQIYLNDLFTNRRQFFADQIALFSNEEVAVDCTYFKLLQYLNFETRTDFFITQKLRGCIDQVIPSWMEKVSQVPENRTYLQINIFDDFKYEISMGDEDKNALYILNTKQRMTYAEYFSKWEALLKELQLACG